MDSPAQFSDEIPDTPHLSIEVPDVFASITEARDSFESVNRVCVHHYPKIMRSVPEEAAPGMSAYLLRQYGGLFHKWCTALAHLEETRGRLLTTKERMGLKLLNISRLNTIMYYQYAMANEAALFSSDTTPFSWDQFNSQFDEIVSLAASVVEATYESDSSGPLNEGNPARPLFSLDNGVIGPLYNVATLCRDPIIRRKAVNVLRSAQRQEGVFNSNLCAIVAEKIIEIEERASSGAISDYPTHISSLKSIVSDTKLRTTAGAITKSSEVPDTARLTYAYPKFDMIKQQIFLSIGQSMKMDVNIPWPAMDFLVDV